MIEANDILWNEIVAREGKTLMTHKGKTFTFHIKRPKNEETSGEIVIDGRPMRITRSTVLLAYHGALETQKKKGCVDSPRRLGAYGDIYLYPIFLDIGICGKCQGESVRDLEEEASQANASGGKTESSIMAGMDPLVEKTSESKTEIEVKKTRCCEKCGYTTEEDFAFCPKCGSRLTG